MAGPGTDALERIALHLAAELDELARDRGCSPDDLSSTVVEAVRDRLLLVYQLGYADGSAAIHERDTLEGIIPVGTWDKR